MLNQDLINLAARGWKIIAVTTLIMLLSTAAYGMKKNATPFETTVFVSIGTKVNLEKTITNSYEAVQAADAFTETVQGWLKNPKLLAQIVPNQNLDSRKQEKQNIVITYSNANVNEAHQVAQNINNLLVSNIADYNLATNSNFTLAMFSENTTTKSSGMLLYIILGLILGLSLGYGFTYITEFLFNQAIFQQDLINIFKKSPLNTQKKDQPSHAELTYLKSFQTKNSASNSDLQLIGLNFNPSKLAHELNAQSIVFPDQIEKINPQNRHLIIAKLGTTKIADATKALRLINPNFEYVIISR